MMHLSAKERTMGGSTYLFLWICFSKQISQCSGHTAVHICPSWNITSRGHSQLPHFFTIKHLWKLVCCIFGWFILVVDNLHWNIQNVLKTAVLSFSGLTTKTCFPEWVPVWLPTVVFKNMSAFKPNKSGGGSGLELGAKNLHHSWHIMWLQLSKGQRPNF